MEKKTIYNSGKFAVINVAGKRIEFVYCGPFVIHAYCSNNGFVVFKKGADTKAMEDYLINAEGTRFVGEYCNGRPANEKCAPKHRWQIWDITHLMLSNGITIQSPISEKQAIEMTATSPYIEVLTSN